LARKPSLAAIFLTVVLDLLGFGLVLPFLAEEARAVFHTTEFVASLMAAIYSLMQFLFVPVWGRLSDRVGRRPVMVWSVAATVVGMAGLGGALAWGDGIFWLFAARAFSGMATANLGTASAYIADVTPPKDRAKGMGLIGMAFGLGFIIGPGIGGALADVTINGRHGPLACFVAAGLSVVNLVWVYLGLGESLPPDKRDPNASRSLAPLNVAAMKRAFSIPGVLLAVVANFLIILAFTNLDQTFRFYNKDMFQMSLRETGFIFFFIGTVAALVQGVLIRKLAARFHEATLIRAGVLLQAIAFAGIAASPWYGKAALYASGAILALGNGLSQPSTSAYVSKRASETEQGNTLGTNQAFASLARMIGPAAGGYLYTALGPRAPYLSGAIGMVVALLVAFGLTTPGEAPAPRADAR
jgi:MFS family permease